MVGALVQQFSYPQNVSKWSQIWVIHILNHGFLGVSNMTRGWDQLPDLKWRVITRLPVGLAQKAGLVDIDDVDISLCVSVHVHYNYSTHYQTLYIYVLVSIIII
jgi:hypothetical protein